MGGKPLMAMMRQAGRQRQVFVVILLIAVCVSIGAVWVRGRVEQADQTVGVIIDYTSTQELAQVSHQSLPSVLAAMRQAGVWGVALDELTVEQAAHEGMLMLLDGEEAGPALQLMGLGVLPIKLTSQYLVWWPESTPAWLVRSMRLHIEPDAHTIASKDSLVVWEIATDLPYVKDAQGPVTAENVSRVGLGLSEDDMRVIRQAGLVVVPRFLHSPTITAQQVQFRLSQINSDAFSGVPIVFSGARVAGYPDLKDEWVRGMHTQQIPIALIEFTNQPGSTQVGTALAPNILRLHTITIPEMEKIVPEVAVARWLRAVRERNIRLLYVRPLPVTNPVFSATAVTDGFITISAETLLQQNLAYVAEITQALIADGFTLGMPQPLTKLVFPWWILPLLAAGVTVGAWWLCLHYLDLPRWWGYLLVGTSMLGFTALYLKGYTVLARQAFALLAAIVFPVLGILVASERGVKDQNAFKSYFMAAGISLVGALLVVGLLADVRFMQKIAQFAGVKLAHIGPPALIFFAVVLAPLPLALYKGERSIFSRIKHIWQQQVPVPYLACAGLLGLAAVVYLLRTGNEGLTVPAFEQRLREWLEVLLVARPRTKEVFIGHPLLVVALDQLTKGRKTLAGWLMIGASIGQLSMVNTFSHIHTPLWISALRTGFGLIFGLAIGWLIFRPALEWLVRLFGQRESSAALPKDS